MLVSVTNAKARLTDLVRRAEAGEDVVLTRHGQASVRLVAVAPATPKETRLQIMRRIAHAAASEATPGPCAARSQDFLYDEFGLPG